MRTKLWLTTFILSLIFLPVSSETFIEVDKDEVMESQQLPDSRVLAIVDYDLDVENPRFYVTYNRTISLSNLQSIPWVNYHTWSTTHLDFTFNRSDFLFNCILNDPVTSYYDLPVVYDPVYRESNPIRIYFSTQKAKEYGKKE